MRKADEDRLIKVLKENAARPQRKENAGPKFDVAGPVVDDDKNKKAEAKSRWLETTGALGLAAVVGAFPFTLPSVMPEALVGASAVRPLLPKRPCGQRLRHLCHRHFQSAT